MRSLLSLLVVLGGCTAAEADLSCPSLTNDAEELTLQLVELGYGSFSFADPFPTGAGEVLQTEESWNAAVDRWGGDGGLSPDFATDFVFVNRWNYSGCDAMHYAGWLDGSRLRVVLSHEEPENNCDMALPQVDLIQVPHGGATDIAWCAPE
ncbi:MAG: hypothetical protein KC912_22685 [Proteobacteria bacterium]|nr:hypothetical protein [Pseudomonadota bacterium]